MGVKEIQLVPLRGEDKSCVLHWWPTCASSELSGPMKHGWMMGVQSLLVPL